jgi:CubicO group peptidase (beta-lactamase class C family)
METGWTALVEQLPGGPVRGALEWVASVVESPGEITLARMQDGFRPRWPPLRQARRELDELRRLRSPFRLAGFEPTSQLEALVRFETADGLHVRLQCELSAHDLGYIASLRLDWISSDDIPLTNWAQVPHLMKHYRVRALSVGYAGADGRPAVRAWGAGPETRFAAGSISKSITAVAALALVEHGALGLDDDVNDRLTSWRVPASGSWRPRVTLRGLLSHSAGLPLYGFVGYGPGDRKFSALELLQGYDPSFRPVRVELLPGLVTVYSNAGFGVVQQLVEEVTGRSFATVARELVLEPLGMAASVMAPSPPPHLLDRTAPPCDQFGEPLSWLSWPGLAYAGLITTAGDLCRFACGIQQAVAGTPGAVLSPALVAEMLTPVAHPSIGLGAILSTSGVRRFAHRGGMPGCAAALTATAEPGPAVAVLTTRDRGSALFWSAMTLGALEVSDEELFVPHRTITEGIHHHAGRAVVQPSGERVLASDVVLGTYRVREGYELTVTAAAGGACVSVPGQEPIPLLMAGDGAVALEGLATTLRFDGPGSAVVRQGTQEWKLEREP